MGGGSGGGGSGSQATKSGPPKWELPYAKQLTNQAAGLFSGSGYPQQQVAPFSPDQQAAMGQIAGMTDPQSGIIGAIERANQAIAGGQDPNINAALAANQQTISGKYLDPSSNPALQSYIQAGMDPIIANYTGAVEPN